MNHLPFPMKKGFTLVEVLVTIGIVAGLAALLIPVVGGLARRNEVHEAQSEAEALATAWENYFNTYNRWPSAWGGREAKFSKGIEMERVMVKLLRPRYDQSNADNP